MVTYRGRSQFFPQFARSIQDIPRQCRMKSISPERLVDFFEEILETTDSATMEQSLSNFVNDVANYSMTPTATITPESSAINVPEAIRITEEDLQNYLDNSTYDTAGRNGEDLREITGRERGFLITSVWKGISQAQYDADTHGRESYWFLGKPFFVQDNSPYAARRIKIRNMEVDANTGKLTINGINLISENIGEPYVWFEYNNGVRKTANIATHSGLPVLEEFPEVSDAPWSDYYTSLGGTSQNYQSMLTYYSLKIAIQRANIPIDVNLRPEQSGVYFFPSVSLNYETGELSYNYGPGSNPKRKNVVIGKRDGRLYRYETPLMGTLSDDDL